jgi:hypothetical protein
MSTSRKKGAAGGREAVGVPAPALVVCVADGRRILDGLGCVMTFACGKAWRISASTFSAQSCPS